jgi:hypothetical protein
MTLLKSITENLNKKMSYLPLWGHDPSFPDVHLLPKNINIKIRKLYFFIIHPFVMRHIEKDNYMQTHQIFLIILPMNANGSSSSISKIHKSKTYIYMQVNIFACCLYGCETWSPTLKEESKLGVFENQVLRSIFEHKRDELTGEWRR